MNNIELAKIFQSMSYILEIKGVQWKPQAYKRAARSIDSLQEDVAEVYKKSGLKGLEEIPGVGEGIGNKIVEFLKTGKIREYEILKKSIPKPVVEMMQIQGMGPKRAKLLYQKLHIKSVAQLEQAAKQHKLQMLKTFKEKAEENILKGIELLRKTGKKRYPIAKVLPIAEKIKSRLEKVKGVKEVYLAGSLRRKEETIGDLDILAITKDHSKAIDKFVNMPEVSRVLAKGITKAAVILNTGMQSDLRVIPKESMATALNYFTGNRDHGVKLRVIAIKKGYKLSEYGLFDRKTGRRIPCKDEKGLYNKLGMEYIPPEKRKNQGEIEEAINGYNKRKIRRNSSL